MILPKIKNFFKTPLIDDMLYQFYPDKLGHTPAIICIVLIFSFFLFLCSRVIYGQDQYNNSNQSDVLRKVPETPKTREHTRIKEVGGEIIIDGSLRVLELNTSKMTELVQISTPVTPSTGRARIWLESTDGDLKVIFSNGTTKVIATN